MLKRILHQRAKILVFALIALLAPKIMLTSDDSVDMLAYTDPESGSLMLYDPRSRVSIALLEDFEFYKFSFSIDGRIAFSSNHEGHSDIYILDTKAPNRSPVNISNSPLTDEVPLAWSHDGRYLAFVSYFNDRNGLIYVWDGQTAINITPDDRYDPPESYEVAWSFDKRLAFTVRYGSTAFDTPWEIYLWDGKTTTNLSQNPLGGDYSPAWNAAGEVAFLSFRDDEYDIFIWDGVSVKNGMPDRNTFINAATEVTGYISHPKWTHEGNLAFTASSPNDPLHQIYMWDRKTTINVSQNPEFNNFSATWYRDGRWAFVTFGLLYIRDADNQTILTTEGQYPPAWSADGNLIFCKWGWTLSMWDGEEIVEITQGQNIWAQWQSGASVVCSSG